MQTVEPNVSLYDYSKREGGLIFRHYGNSLSLVMFTLGNELGRNQGMFDLVAHFKQVEPRALHAQGSNNMHWDVSLAAGDDFWVTAKVGPDQLIRGAFSLADSRNPHIEYHPPSTRVDYRRLIERIPVPVISHEIGAFQVSPDFRDIPKFTGVLEARSYEIFRERLENAGMLDQAHDFVRASGALAAICYREDFEAALRTPGFGGFQLLDIIQDKAPRWWPCSTAPSTCPVSRTSPRHGNSTIACSAMSPRRSSPRAMPSPPSCCKNSCLSSGDRASVASITHEPQKLFLCNQSNKPYHD